MKVIELQEMVQTIQKWKEGKVFFTQMSKQNKKLWISIKMTIFFFCVLFDKSSWIQNISPIKILDLLSLISFIIQS